jgi:hypothetical protein
VREVVSRSQSRSRSRKNSLQKSDRVRAARTSATRADIANRPSASPSTIRKTLKTRRSRLAAIASSFDTRIAAGSCDGCIILTALHTTSEKRPRGYFSLADTVSRPGCSPRVAVRHRRASNAAARSRCFRSFSNFRIWVSIAPGVLPSCLPTAAWRRLATAAMDSPFGAAASYSLCKRASRQERASCLGPAWGGAKHARKAAAPPLRLSVRQRP